MKFPSFFLFLLSSLAVIALQAQTVPKRPQEPSPPYPYLTEEVVFQNHEANIQLAGTLTLPKNKSGFPMVILISGSSPHNRDEAIAGHKPFLVIADYLTKNGIGVLRYDDRGVGQSGGNYEIAAYADRMSDVKSALAYLKSRKATSNSKTGLLGHSEGGLIAAMIAAGSEDIGFIVLMAAPGITGAEMILLQTKLSNKAQGISDEKTQTELDFLKIIFDEVIAANDLAHVKSQLSDSLKSHRELLPDGMTDEEIDQYLGVFAAPWFQRILKSDPASSLEQVQCPVLALNGAKDLQIPPKENLGAIEAALKKGGNNKYTIKELPNLNHLFQEAATGQEEEFVTIRQTISPVVLKMIMDWIGEHP